jgi:hypothetical protein
MPLRSRRRSKSAELSNCQWSGSIRYAKKGLLTPHAQTVPLVAGICVRRSQALRLCVLHQAREIFDEVQAKRKREKMALAAEERRVRKEEEAAAAKAVEEAAGIPPEDEPEGGGTIALREEGYARRQVQQGR